MGETSSSVWAGKARIGLTLLAFVAYISIGLPDTLVGVAWPSIRAEFSLPLDALGTLFVAMTMGYLTSSFFGGRMMSRLRLGALLAAGCVAAGVSMIGYAAAPTWRTITLVGVLAGLGGGAIEVGLNTYVASNRTDRVMQWLHASYGVGAMLGPLLMTGGIRFFNTWRFGYLVAGGLQFALAICFCSTVSLWERPTTAAVSAERADRPMNCPASIGQTLRQPRVWLSMALFFLYMGIEFTLASWAYTLLTESRHVPVSLAGLWMGSYYGIYTVGRILAGLYAGRVNRRALITGGLLAALLGSLLLIWNPTDLASMGAVTFVGFSMAPILPGLISGTAGRVGAPHLGNAMGMQIAAMAIGAASLSSLAGILAQRISLEAIPLYLTVLMVVLIACYAFSWRVSAEQSKGGALRSMEVLHGN